MRAETYSTDIDNDSVTILNQFIWLFWAPHLSLSLLESFFLNDSCLRITSEALKWSVYQTITADQGFPFYSSCYINLFLFYNFPEYLLCQKCEVTFMAIIHCWEWEAVEEDKETGRKLERHDTRGLLSIWRLQAYQRKQCYVYVCVCFTHSNVGKGCSHHQVEESGLQL